MKYPYRTFIRSSLHMVTNHSAIRLSIRGLVQMGLLPKAVWRRIPVDGEFRVTFGDNFAFRYCSNQYDRVGRGLFWKGLNGYEAAVVHVFLELARQADTILDLGANTGLYTLLACAINHNSKVYAIEPVPRVFAHLEKNINLNGWASRCVTINEALSNSVGEATLYIPHTREDRVSQMAYSASLQGDWQHPDKTREKIHVKVRTIDEILDANQIVQLVKMDVEGVEDKVIEGMQRTIAHSKPTIIFEARPDGPSKRVESLLAEHGYHFWHLLPSGPRQIDCIPDLTRTIHFNFLASHYPNWQSVSL